MATPRLIVAGNCQARFIAQLLEANPLIAERYKVIYFRNFRAGDQGPLSEKNIRNCDILLEQIAHGAPEMPQKSLLPKWTKVIRFPIVWFNSLWPTYTRDARNPPKGAGEQLWPYGDRLILDALKEGLSPEAATQRWFEADVASHIDIDRFHQINAAKADELDRRAEIKLGSYAQNNFRSERLFVTHNHPSFRMLEVMRDRIYEALNLPPGSEDLRPASGGMYHTHVPIHPSVAQHFGLQWWSPELPARLRNSDIAPEEFWRMYAAFERPPTVAGLDFDTE